MERSPKRPTKVVDPGHWRERLKVLAAQYRVPGATLGILRGGQIVDVAAGVLSTATHVTATPESVFQIGSVSKIWTTTLIMQLVDEGVLRLDTPIAQVIPEFAVADAEVTNTVTVYHLLTHTSGIDGDLFIDTGGGDDCLARYVARMNELRQLHPIGGLFSYCNAGFILAGRLVEVTTGLTWDAALRERIIRPLGLTATVTLPEEAILHRAAVGHIDEPGGRAVPTRIWAMPRNRGPSGRVMTSVRDVLTFVQMHLRDGLTPDGTRILSTESAAAMRERQVDVLDSSARGDSWGLGWSRFGWDGERLIGHDGGTIGQTAYLRIMPAQNFAVALLINGGDAAALYEDIFAEVFRELTDLRMPAPFGPPADRPVVDVNPYVGRYRRLGFDTMVSNRDGVLVLRTTATGPLGGLLPELTSEHELVPVGKDHFAIRRAATSTWESVRFHTLSDGTAYLYFHNGARANKRIEIPREATDT